MTSKVVLMLSIIAIIDAINAITTNDEAADLQTDKHLLGVASEVEGCPYLDNAEYEVTVKGSVSKLIGGCACINYNSSDIELQTFSLRFGNIYDGAENCRDRGIEYFRFYCLSKSPSPSEDIRRGRMYIKLYDETVNKAERQVRRCAVYDKSNDNEYVTTFRVALSNNNSCEGLSDVLYNPEQIRLHKKAFMLLVFSRTRPDAPLTPSAPTTTESIQSISNRYERWGSILENFGNRPNPFWKTKSTEIQDSGKRELQMSDGRHSTVTDLASNDEFLSNLNDKDVSKSTVMDKNYLRPPLEVNHTQIRKRRSMSNDTSTFKTDVVLAGANPFALLITNRVQNNSTGSIKPLGLWDEIKKLFKF